MECNKEDALKAKELAEKKMQSGDFSGAQRMAMKAQRLYPGLTNISQMLLVCEVHCSAQNKLNGSEMDWYKILQMERFSEESAIKKQFRKLALSLHPDKNKFPGAEAAFKLIEEANRVLTDPTKRALHNSKCGGTSGPTKPKPEQSNQNTSQHSHQQNTQQAKFWTRCPFCNMWYQFHKQYQKMMRTCQKCTQPFIAHDLGTPLYQQPQQAMFWTRCPSCNMGYQCQKQYQKTMFKCQNCSHMFIAHDLGMQSASGCTKVPIPKAGKAADASRTSQSKEKKETVHVYVKEFKPREKVNEKSKEEKKETVHVHVKEFKSREKVNGHVDVEAGKRGNLAPKPDESKTNGVGNAENTSNKRCEKSSVSSDAKNAKQNGSKFSPQKSQAGDGHQCRKSLRKKPNKTCNEKSNDDDDFVAPPRSKGDNSSVVNDKEMKRRASSGQDNGSLNKKRKTMDSKIEGDEVMSEKLCMNKDEKSETGANTLNLNGEPESDICFSPDPDFTNFERLREQSAFAVDQIWAIYDAADSMPRYYARIRKVIKPGFKVQITWLETRSNNKVEKKWSDLGLPVACGRYVNGGTETSEDILMFSHKMSHVNAGFNGGYFVYPKKGETWALYKNWNLEWSTEPDKHVPPFDIDVVEILTDYIDEVGIGVVYLGKVKGFVSVFQRGACNGVISFTVRPDEMYRFSHQIPSSKLTGKEREGVPVESYELDTAALPANFCVLGGNDKNSEPKNLESSATTETRSTVDFQATKMEKNKFADDNLAPRRSPRDLSKGRSKVQASRSTAETTYEHSAATKD